MTLEDGWAEAGTLYVSVGGQQFGMAGTRAMKIWGWDMSESTVRTMP